MPEHSEGITSGWRDSKLTVDPRIGRGELSYLEIY